ncbi:TPA: hypothetical protein ACS29Y_002530 [Raoultella planticola]
MIYPFDASYAQKVLRIHYEYADVIVRKRERLAARTAGLIAHDRMLTTSDKDASNAAHRRELSLNTLRIEARAA